MAKRLRLIDAVSGKILLERLRVADSFQSRFIGLQFRRALPHDEGLLIVPCRSIHTHWMRFTIDAYFINRRGVVIDASPSLKPWRYATGPSESYAVLETTSGTLGEELTLGMRLAVVGDDGMTCRVDFRP